MRYETDASHLNTQISILKSLRTFFDILEEVIEKRENNSRDVVFKNQELRIKKQDANLAT